MEPLSKIEIVRVNDVYIIIRHVPKECLAPAFGLALLKDKKILVRNDLPERVKRFVQAHEMYHLFDQHGWWGVFGQELRANIVPGLKDPLGLLATLWMTITSKERILFYIDRARKGY